MDNIKINITPIVKNNTTGTNITKPTIINVDNDSIKAINNKTKTNTKANPKNMKKPKSISTIRNGIVIIIKGAIRSANKNKKGNPSSSKGAKIINKKPIPSNIKGLNIRSNTINPPNTNAPNAKNVPIVKKIKLPIKIIASIAIPPNTKAPASKNGKNINISESTPLAIIVATIENANIGNDNRKIKVAPPIQAIVVTLKNTMTPTVKEP